GNIGDRQHLGLRRQGRLEQLYDFSRAVQRGRYVHSLDLEAVPGRPHIPRRVVARMILSQSTTSSPAVSATPLLIVLLASLVLRTSAISSEETFRCSAT